MTLKATTGPTTLFSANLPSYLAGGPTNEVDWQTTSLTGVNLSNYLLTLKAATISVLVLSPIPVAGDYNQNGIVDAADYILWRNTVNQSDPNLAADGDHNNQIDTADYTYWKTRFNDPTPGAGGAADIPAIPEPHTLLLLATASLFISRNGKPRHKKPRPANISLPAEESL